MLLFFKFCRSFELHDTLHKIRDVPSFTATPPWLKLPTDLPLLDIRALVIKQERLFASFFPAIILLRLHLGQRIFTVITAERYVLPAPPPGWPCYFLLPLLEINLHYHFPIKAARISREKQSKDRRGVPRYTGMFAYSIDGHADETPRIDWDRE